MRSVLRFATIALALFVATPGAMAAAYPAGSVVEGKTLGEWSAEWWKWALSAPTSTNPILDTTGASAGLGDVGPVFFLAGTFETTPVTRAFSVPGDKPIFFPLINSFLSAEGDADVMRQRLDAFIDAVTTLHASVDGVAIPDLVLAS